MNKLKWVFYLYLVFFNCMAFASSKEAVNMTVDFESAHMLVDILSKDKISDQQLEKLMGLQGIQATIHQTSRFDNGATAEVFKSTLVDVIEGRPNTYDPFRFHKLKDDLLGLKKIITTIENNPQHYINDVRQGISSYSPNNLSIETNIFIVVGGTSDGWAKDGNFYIALQYFKGDYKGLLILSIHELYHVAQPYFYGKSQKPDSSCEKILNQTRMEGIASIVGSPFNVTEGKEYIVWFQQKYKTNLQRISDNFVLLEMMLYRACNDPDVEFDRIYPLGFSGRWNSPLYYVGYYIGNTIEEIKGRDFLISTLKKSPSAMFKAYIDIYKEDKAKDIPRFDESTENIILAL
ncbi:hypothetical protein MO867_19320 [Microbulbifer sp. OS29]|uniref:DUF2268 domain-containing protein n=1 Tax=Microbulbifer okhotskensis TaxID=2926617 RepID=A0A9X2EV43_9GAMM|nr:DUF5700 domain-containing putative Zn-dependent protease [Microbulbifer okhotskensis]MCO1336486.1 hypothetical protein [Microbulbifer okhotskensis]